MLKLVGVQANKAAIGSKVIVSVQENGAERKIYRMVSSGASFGANSLALEIGLGKATAINNVTVQWPCINCPDQTFTGMDINKAYVLTQGQSTASNVEYTKSTKTKPTEHHHH